MNNDLFDLNAQLEEADASVAEPMPAEVLDLTGRWRARDVNYWSGKWQRLSKLVPSFTLEPFRAHSDAPANPHLSAVVRVPLHATEHPMPVATVSKTYHLAQHHEVVDRCFAGLRRVGVDPKSLKCEVGLSQLGEWMNFRAYFPEEYSYKPKDGNDLGLRLECFNSVDGSSRLVILFGWLRFVCSNGLVIGETKAELKDVHDQHLNLDVIPDMIAEGLKKVNADLQRLKKWELATVASDALKSWANTVVSETWGKKAACRVFHICQTGHDVEIVDPFAKGEATDKPVVLAGKVPGAAHPAKTLYDVSQALSWLATNRNNTEERVDWQTAIPKMITALRELSDAA
ncbi:MAG: DUF932 domain-containing protein [Verrucomicrobiota bacterium]